MRRPSRSATGALLGFYGGQDYLESQINWAVAGGMAGSTMKAATDVAAIRDGFSLNDTFEGNSPIEVADIEFENQGDEDYGSAVSMITATENSINTAFIDMVDSMDNGPEKVIQAAEDMGIPGIRRRALGDPAHVRRHAGERRRHPRQRQRQPDQHGQRLRHARQRRGPPRHPRRAEGRRRGGETLYEAKERSKQTIDTDIASDVTYALQQVVEEGSGTEALALDRPVAGKTGTATNDDGDVSSTWFVGTTPADLDCGDVRPGQGP